MKVLFITAQPYLPQMYGGLQNSTHQLCQSLTAKGHEVAVLCALTPDGWLGAKSRVEMQVRRAIGQPKVARDTALGYPVWRAWYPWDAVSHAAKSEKPDLIVVMAVKSVRMALAAKPTGVPLLMQLQDVEFQRHDGPFEALGEVPCVANSQFTAARYREAYGVNPAVIYPFIELERYRTNTTRENVTFINPVPAKGRDIVLEIARRCPEIPFSFIESWPLSEAERGELEQVLANLPNVTLLKPQSDMRSVYGKCKILLAPSIWEEAYGRVATEAQVSGIPVVTSNRGGLPEAVGPGGLVLDPTAPIEDWVSAVSALWHDDDRYAQLSSAARAYAERDEGSLQYKLGRWEELLQSAGR